MILWLLAIWRSSNLFPYFVYRPAVRYKLKSYRIKMLLSIMYAKTIRYTYASLFLSRLSLLHANFE